MMGRGVFLSFCITILLSGGTQAMDANGLRGAVQRYLETHTDTLLARAGGQGRLQFAIAGIDPRFYAPDCRQPLQFAIKDQGAVSSRLNVQVSCAAGNNWSNYVPVDIAIFRRVITAANPLARDVAIKAGDLMLAERDITELNGQYLTRAEDVIGLSAKRTLAPGTIVTRDNLLQPLLIRRGDAVTIKAEADGLIVHMPGVAMTDGRRGEPIRVKNINSAKMVDAQVVEAGVVSVPM